MTNINL